MDDQVGVQLITDIKYTYLIHDKDVLGCGYAPKSCVKFFELHDLNCMGCVSCASFANISQCQISHSLGRPQYIENEL